jgi:hypothetical protein
MASVAYEYECDKNSGFLPDPNEHKRVGYVTSLAGFGQTSQLVFKADLTVYTPWNSTEKINAVFGGKSSGTGPAGMNQNALGKLNVVGVLEKIAWNGGAGDFIALDFWMSQENAIQLKSAQQSTLTTTRVDECNWWCINYDQEKKVWYEQAYPNTAITGIVGPQDNPELNVDLTGAPAKDGIDVMVYKVSMQVACGANQQYSLTFANAANAPNVKSWGLIVGTFAKTAYGG